MGDGYSIDRPEVNDLYSAEVAPGMIGGFILAARCPPQLMSAQRPECNR